MKHSEARQAFLQAYVEQLAAGLGLRDWRLTVSRKLPSDPVAYAETKVWWSSTTATIRIGTTVLGDRDQLRATTVHELLHCYTEHLYKSVSDAFSGAVTDAVWHTFRKIYRSEIERSVDHLARAIARGAPLPEWPVPA